MFTWCHLAQADMFRRIGRTGESLEAYNRALALTQNKIEREFIRGRIRKDTIT